MGRAKPAPPSGPKTEVTDHRDEYKRWLTNCWFGDVPLAVTPTSQRGRENRAVRSCHGRRLRLAALARARGIRSI